MFSWLSSKEVVQFGKTVAREFAEQFPPGMERAAGDKELKQYRAALQSLKAKAVAYNAEKKLGIYKKAKLGNAIKWELKECGFTEEVADEITHAVIINIAVTPK